MAVAEPSSSGEGAARRIYHSACGGSRWWVVAWAAVGALLTATAVLLALGLTGTLTDLHGSNGIRGRHTAALTFFVIGNWGTNGSDTQLAVAALMKSVAQRSRPDFIVSTGDNFLPYGLRSLQDGSFDASFTRVYGGSRGALAVPWYAVLGEADYVAGLPSDLLSTCAATSLDACDWSCCYSPVWQLSSRRRDPFGTAPQWYAERSYALSVANSDTGLVFVDTTPLFPENFAAPWARVAGGVDSQRVADHKAHLRARFAGAAPAAWRIVVGHHPVVSSTNGSANGSVVGAPELRFLWDELREQPTHLYLSGHGNVLEHVTPGDAVNTTQFVNSGTGGGSTTGDDAIANGSRVNATSAFRSTQPGFVSVQVYPSKLVVTFYTTRGGSKPTYSFTIPAPASEAS